MDRRPPQDQDRSAEHEDVIEGVAEEITSELTPEELENIQEVRVIGEPDQTPPIDVDEARRGIEVVHRTTGNDVEAPLEESGEDQKAVEKKIGDLELALKTLRLTPYGIDDELLPHARKLEEELAELKRSAGIEIQEDPSKKIHSKSYMNQLRTIRKVSEERKKAQQQLTELENPPTSPHLPQSWVPVGRKAQERLQNARASVLHSSGRERDAINKLHQIGELEDRGPEESVEENEQTMQPRNHRPAARRLNPGETIQDDNGNSNDGGSQPPNLSRPPRNPGPPTPEGAQAEIDRTRLERANNAARIAALQSEKDALAAEARRRAGRSGP